MRCSGVRRRSSTRTRVYFSDHFSTEEHVTEVPFTGILVGVLENPVALSGHPPCHVARIDAEPHAEVEAETDRGEFDGYRMLGLRWIEIEKKRSETLVFREIQNDGLPVDTKPDVVDRVVARSPRAAPAV